MSMYESISLCLQEKSFIVSSIASICSIVALFLTLVNIHMLRKQSFEQNKGEILFFPKYNDVNDTIKHFQLINIGKSHATLNSITTQPELSWLSNKRINDDSFDISKLNNIFLAPNQSISVSYDVKSIETDKIAVKIIYTTMGKKQKSMYSLNMSSYERILNFDRHPNNITDAIYDLSQNIESLRNYNGF